MPYPFSTWATPHCIGEPGAASCRPPAGCFPASPVAFPDRLITLVLAMLGFLRGPLALRPLVLTVRPRRLLLALGRRVRRLLRWALLR